MSSFITIIRGDYLQRTRSYAFLVTLAISLYAAYAFVPAPDAPYTTVRVGDYVGDYNASWIGYVTAIMTSVFLAMVGFFLVNNSVKRDVDTEVGMIIATTRISNFNYLISKVLSNFLVLLSITGMVIMMSIAIFFFRSRGFPFEITPFLLPFLFVTLPSLFVIASLAVVAEVFLNKRPVLQYIGFFILFNIVLANVQMSRNSSIISMLDPFGIKMFTTGMQQAIQQDVDAEEQVVSMGFIFGNKKEVKVFVFEGFDWPGWFLISRVSWMVFGIGLVFVSSRFFHRFDVREKSGKSRKVKSPVVAIERGMSKSISLSSLPAITPDYSIGAFIKTELLVIYRKGPRWFWLVNLGGMMSLIFAPITIAHQMLLPILWFLQVSRWSDLTTKEKTSRIHYFTFASYQPLRRLLPSQVISGVILAWVLASPLLVRYGLVGQFLPLLAIITGAIFIVLFSACLGIVSGGKKLFEVLFFVITYMNLNRVPFADYFGGFWTSMKPMGLMMLIIGLLAVVSWSVRSYEIRHS